MAKDKEVKEKKKVLRVILVEGLNIDLRID